jgi:hypothetical protein
LIKKTPEFAYGRIYEMRTRTLDFEDKLTLVIEYPANKNSLAGVGDLAFCSRLEYLNIRLVNPSNQLR